MSNTPRNSQRFQPPSSTAQASANSPSPSGEPSHSSRPKPLWLLMFTAVIGAIVVLSAIRKSESIQAEATLKTDPKAHDVVRMKIPGKITRIDASVVPNALLTKDSVIAEFENPPLPDEAPGDWVLRSQEASARIETTKQQAGINAVKVQQAEDQQQLLQTRIQQLKTELQQIREGTPPPHIRALDNQITHLQESREPLKATITSVEKLVREKAFPEVRLNELKRQQSDLEAQIAQAEAAKESTVRRMKDDLKSKEDDYNRLITAQQVTQQELVASKETVKTQQPILGVILNEKGKRDQRQANNKTLGFVSKKMQEGIVITPNPQLIVGKVLQKDEAVIEVANPRKLQAVIEIRPEDVDLVRKGAVVKLKLRGSALPAIETKVGEFLPTYSSTEQPNRKVLRVISGTIDLNNLILETGSPEHREALRDRLKPDAQLDATIQLKDEDKLNFLQICYREVGKFLKSVGLR